MIRAAASTDADAIARVHVASWRTTYSGLLPDDFLASLSDTNYAERWRRVIAEGSSRVYVAEDAGEVVGFASGGRELVGSTVGGLRELGLGDLIIWVLRDNSPARAFYERLGGVYVRTQPITIGPVTLEEVSYGWRRLDDVRF